MTPTNPAFLRELLNQISDGIYFVDCQRRILYWNSAATRLTGYTAEEMVGRSCDESPLLATDCRGRDLCHGDCPVLLSLTEFECHEGVAYLRHKTGRRVPVAMRSYLICGYDRKIAGAALIFHDNSTQVAMQRKTDEMRRLAFLDSATNLPNRRYMEMSLQTALVQYEVHRDSFGAMMIDLDCFKEINDRYGHAIGDQALQQVARTLVGALRCNDVVSRWGGDEFVALVYHVDISILRTLAERCSRLVSASPFPISYDTKIFLSVSIGHTLVLPQDDVNELIERADQRMYEQKLARKASRALRRGFSSTSRGSR